MKITTVISLFIKAALAVAVALVSVSMLMGASLPKGFCERNDHSSDEKVSFKELREMTVPASGSLTVDGGKNGGIRVKGENRADVLIRACVQAWGTSEEDARAVVSNIRIATNPVKAEGGDETRSGVSYEILVPRATDLRLTANNGGISIAGVDGRLEFETMNGGVHLQEIGGDVRGRTTNGGLHIALSGSTWRGSGLDVQTTNGGVHLSVPTGYAANIETGTVNGGFKSNIPELNITLEDKKADRINGSRAVRIQTAINGGGPPVRVVTTNGGVKINVADAAARQL